MSTHIFLPVSDSIRKGLTQKERWHDSDKGIIACWERGREMRDEDPELAKRAEAGELVMLHWWGGVERQLKESTKKKGNLWYLATWQGLRGEDLDIDLEVTYTKTCTRHNQLVYYSHCRR